MGLRKIALALSLLMTQLLASTIAAPAGNTPAPTTEDPLYAAIGRADWSAAQAIAADRDKKAGHGDILAVYVHAVRFAASGDCESATTLADAVTRTAPGFLPAHEILAACMARMGDGAGAARVLRRLAEEAESGPTRDLLLARANAVAPDLSPSYVLSASLTPSSNANRGTYEKSIGWGAISEGSRAKSGATASVSAEIRKPVFAAKRLFSTLSLRAGLGYNTVSEQFSPSLRAAFSTSYALSNKTVVKFEPYAHAFFSQDAFTHVEAGVDVSVAHRFSQDLSLGGVVSIGYIDHTSDLRDGIVAFGEVTANKTIGTRDRLSTKIWLSASEREFIVYQNRTLGGEIEWEHAFDGGFIGSVAIGGHVKWHEAFAPLTFEKQRDEQVYARLGASHKKIHIGNIRPELTYTHTRQSSNDAFSRYNAHDVGVRVKSVY